MICKKINKQIVNLLCFYEKIKREKLSFLKITLLIKKKEAYQLLK